MRKHPLHSEAWVKEMKDANLDPVFYHDRKLGTSTGLALQCISKAILQPYIPVEIVDHHRTIPANRFLVKLIEESIEKLGLLEMYMHSRDGRSFYLTFGKR